MLVGVADCGIIRFIQGAKDSSRIRKGKKMLANSQIGKYDSEPIRLHLSLEDDYLSSSQKTMLKRYGESSTGYSITRDVIIPGDMQLHNLHYAIQKLFGWQNSHLRRFLLPEETYSMLTGGKVKGWSKLVGVLFQPPSEGEADLFWDDDYERGSIAAWLKKKYRGPYEYKGYYEDPDVAQEDVKLMLERLQETLKNPSIADVTLKELNRLVYMECDQESLLERLKVADVLGGFGLELPKDKLFPTTDVLYYNYDFGDDWNIKITRPDSFEDLLEQNLIEPCEIDEAITRVITKHIPVCICADGLFLVDDVGGLGGFSDMLEAIYESDDKEEKSSMKAWSTSMGWSSKKIALKSIL